MLHCSLFITHAYCPPSSICVIDNALSLSSKRLGKTKQHAAPFPLLTAFNPSSRPFCSNDQRQQHSQHTHLSILCHLKPLCFSDSYLLCICSGLLSVLYSRLNLVMEFLLYHTTTHILLGGDFHFINCPALSAQ